MLGDQPQISCLVREMQWVPDCSLPILNNLLRWTAFESNRMLRWVSFHLKEISWLEPPNSYGIHLRFFFIIMLVEISIFPTTDAYV